MNTLWLAQLLVATASTSECPTGGQAQHVLVLSGGLSRGAYQAGATYAEMRKRRINGDRTWALSGASAGAVNAFLAALDFCRKDLPNHEDSYLWKFWDRLQWEDLREADCDGNLLCFNFLTQWRQDITNHLKDKNHWRPNCTVDLALAFSDLTPRELIIGKEQKIPTFRRLGRIRLRFDPEGQLWVEPQAPDPNERTDVTLYSINRPEKLFSLLMRAAALPYARKVNGDSDDNWLYDSSFFDRLPIYGALRVSTPTATITLIDTQRMTQQQNRRTHGSGFVEDVFKDSVAVVDTLELQMLNRYGCLQARKWASSERSTIITGDLMWGAGSFFSPTFREYDFRVGCKDCGSPPPIMAALRDALEAQTSPENQYKDAADIVEQIYTQVLNQGFTIQQLDPHFSAWWTEEARQLYRDLRQKGLDEKNGPVALGSTFLLGKSLVKPEFFKMSWGVPQARSKGIKIASLLVPEAYAATWNWNPRGPDEFAGHFKWRWVVHTSPSRGHPFWFLGASTQWLRRADGANYFALTPSLGVGIRPGDLYAPLHTWLSEFGVRGGPTLVLHGGSDNFPALPPWQFEIFLRTVANYIELSIGWQRLGVNDDRVPNFYLGFGVSQINEALGWLLDLVYTAL